MGIFKLSSEFKPAGDQPAAIEKLVDSLKADRRYQTLMGVTGSGKTFTMANVRTAQIIEHISEINTEIFAALKNCFAFLLPLPSIKLIQGFVGFSS